MSLIGSLEQFDLANILRRIEVFSKAGLLIVKQGNLWVEFYFRQGQLVCIGPVRSSATLVDRLVQANLLSSQALPQIKETISSAGPNETQIAVALIKSGYFDREMLRTWFAQEAIQILQTIVSWTEGEVYFEDDRPTPADRLLVALSISALLDAMPQAPDVPDSALRPANSKTPSTDEPLRLRSRILPTESPDTGRLEQTEAGRLSGSVQSFASRVSSLLGATQSVEQPPVTIQPIADKVDTTGLLNASQLIDDNPFKQSGSLDEAQLPAEIPPAVTFAPAADPLKGLFGSEIEISAPAQVSSLTLPQPVRNPLPPTRIDTSFMTPELVLVSVDLSSLRERNPQVSMTPDQWRLFALIDGQSSLQAICQTLMAPKEVVCTLAGELMAIGLIMPLTQTTGAFNDFAQTGMNNVPVQSVPYATQPSWPSQLQMSGPMSFAVPTQGQRRNGGSGANFTGSGGLVLSARQGAVQSGQPSGAFAPVGGYR